jgi:hypothetical protein
MAPHDARPGNIDTVNERKPDVMPALTNLLADREAQARAHRRHMHLTLWPSVCLTFSLGILVGVAAFCH